MRRPNTLLKHVINPWRRRKERKELGQIKEKVERMPARLGDAPRAQHGNAPSTNRSKARTRARNGHPAKRSRRVIRMQKRRTAMKGLGELIKRG
jgi:hypothetical protein